MQTKWDLASFFAIIASISTLHPVHACQDGVTIQLPTVSFFNINTVVSVPDGGTMSLGGNSGGNWGSTSRGVPGMAGIPGAGRLFNNSAFGGSQFASNASIHVKIISLAEMEADLLSQLPGDRALSDYAKPQPISLSLKQSHLVASRSGGESFDDKDHKRSEVQTQSRGSMRLYPSDSADKPAVDREKSAKAAQYSHERLPPGEQVVDPNGSDAVQKKADFISRNVGRKKK